MRNLYLIVGRSGSGKTTVSETLDKLYGMKAVQSYCTRKPRYEGETGHTFISKEEFDQHEMIAYTMFDGHEYGVDINLLDQSDTYVIDIEGVKYLKERYHNKPMYTINLRCDRDVLIERMKARGDTISSINKRLENDDKMFAEEKSFKFDFVLDVSKLKTFEIIDVLRHFINEKEHYML